MICLEILAFPTTKQYVEDIENNTFNNFWNLQPIDSTKQYVEHTLNIWRDFSVPFEIYISSALPSTPWNKWTSLACWVIVKDLPSCALQKSTFNINRLGILRHALHVISHESQNLEDRNKVEPLSHLFHPTSPTKKISWTHEGTSQLESCLKFPILQFTDVFRPCKAICSTFEESWHVESLLQIYPASTLQDKMLVLLYAKSSHVVSFC